MRRERDAAATSSRSRAARRPGSACTRSSSRSISRISHAPELERVVAQELAAHGFDAVWLRAVADMVQAVVETPLDESGMRFAA